MRKCGEWRAAASAVGAAAATGYASGRALVIFFMQLGWAAWPGVMLAAASFALLLTGCARLCVRADAGGFAALCCRMLGRGKARVVGVFHGLLLAMAAAVSILNAGELGALTLPIDRGFLWGMGAALALAALLNLRGGRGMVAVGAAASGLAVLFYLALALDPRPPRLYLTGEAVLTLSGSVWAMLALALCHASLNACVAADALCRRVNDQTDPRRLGLMCAAGMAAPLLAGCAALSRGGPLLLASALPTVPLAARWGLAGFWICAGFGYFCNVATLAAALGGLWGWLDVRRRC